MARRRRTVDDPRLPTDTFTETYNSALGQPIEATEARLRIVAFQLEQFESMTANLRAEHFALSCVVALKNVR